MYENDKKAMASVERIIGGVILDSHRSTGFSSSRADIESTTIPNSHKRNITQ
jgi:hypothetical protein